MPPTPDPQAPRPKETRPEPKMPEKFGRYVLIDRVGSGGMADVFRAVTFGWEGFRRIIVVKRIRRELSESPDFLRMFFDEAKISALLHHPNIVQVYDFGQVQGHHFLAMEYLEGKDVASILKSLRGQKDGERGGERRGMDPRLVAYVGREVALGLHYAHTLRGADDQPFDIVHRDINPANVMLLRTGGVKVLDFGIAKASEAAGKSQTQRAIVKGKLSYLSPEQANCERLNGRSDLFSWGATMWEMLTGYRLFGGKTDFERLTAVKQAPVPPPSFKRPEIPEALDRIVLRALERDLERRYQSAEELANDLDLFLKSSPPEADAVTRLLSDLYGDDSTAGITLPAFDDLAAIANGPGESPPPDGDGDGGSQASQVETVGGRSPGDPLGFEISPYVQGEQGGAASDSSPRRTLMAWAATAAAVVMAVALILWTLRVRPVAPHPAIAAPLAAPFEPGSSPASSPTATAAASTAGEGQAMVKLEVDSDPPGARVSGSRGPLGTTPLTLSLPTSTESELLRFDKPGFQPASYEVRPKSAGIVFVELKPAAR